MNFKGTFRGGPVPCAASNTVDKIARMTPTSSFKMVAVTCENGQEETHPSQATIILTDRLLAAKTVFQPCATFLRRRHRGGLPLCLWPFIVLFGSLSVPFSAQAAA